MHHGGNNRGSGKWSESRFNLKVKPRCADVMDVASEEKIASEKTPHFTNLWNREVLFRGLTERGLTVVFFRGRRISSKNLQDCFSKIFPIGNVHLKTVIPRDFCSFHNDL